MPGTIDLPGVGAVDKKYVFVGAGVVVLGAAYYFRNKQQQNAAIAASGANTGIDPATGYAYGSPEDAAALANQAGYVNPTVGTGGGGGSVSNIPDNGLPQGFTSNAAWSQYVVTYFLNNSLIQDSTQLTDALGRYVTGQAPADANQESLINQAVAFAGYPPIAGSDGYPPHIRTAPTTTPTPTGTIVAQRNGNLGNQIAGTNLSSWNALAGWAYWWPGHADANNPLNGYFGSTLAHAQGGGKGVSGVSDPRKVHPITLPATMTT